MLNQYCTTQKNHFDIVKYSIEQGLPSCGIANDSNEMELSWFQKLNNTNKNELLTLANHNRDDYNSSYYSFIMIFFASVKRRRRLKI